MDRPDRPRAYQAPASTNTAKKTGFVNSTKIVQAPFGYAAQGASFHVERASMCHYASFQAPARARDELQLRAIFQRENSNAFLRHAIAARKQLDRAHDVH